MTTNKKERDFLIKMFSQSWLETKVFWKKPTCFSKVLVRTGDDNSHHYVYKRKYTDYGRLISGELIGMVPGSQIVRPTELLIDQLQDIRELIQTRESTNFNGWRRSYVWPTADLFDIIKDFDSQIGTLTESANSEDALILDQILKGLLAEYRN